MLHMAKLTRQTMSAASPYPRRARDENLVGTADAKATSSSTAAEKSFIFSNQKSAGREHH